MPVAQSSRGEIDWELTPDELSSIFAMKDWMYAVSGCYGNPAAGDIERTVGWMSDELDRSGDGYIEFGRFLVFINPEMPDFKEVYLQIGSIHEEADREADE